MDREMTPGMILSREEGQEARNTVINAHKAGYIDMITAVKMAWDIACRTVPHA